MTESPKLRRSDPARVLPEGRVVQVSFVLALPAAASEADVEDWLRLQFGIGTAEADNPLSAHAPIPFSDPTLSDTRMRMREKRAPAPEGGTLVTQWLEPDGR